MKDFIFLLLLFGCGEGKYESLGEKKVCDMIKIRVRACTSRGVEEWGGCEEVSEDLAWESDCGIVKFKLDLGKLEN